jgi:lysophospholipase L1-like esterase
VRLKKVAALAALLVGSTLISIVVAEGLARSISPFPVKYEKLWFLSSPTFRTDAGGAVRYMPNQTIRSVMFRGDAIVYDVHFNTNDLGLIDHEDYAGSGEQRAGGRRYVFVGDSFTAGFHGGTSWVPALRDSAQRFHPDLEIYNLGVSGSGFEQFFRIVQSSATQLDFTEIVVLAISDDFWRAFWTPVATEDSIRFCGEDQPRDACVASVSPVARIFDPELGRAELIALYARLSESQTQGPRGLRDRVLESSRLVALLRQQYVRLQRKLLKDKSLARLRDLREAFQDKPMRFIHLPSMRELGQGAYDLDLEDDIAKLGIEYFPAMTACSWPEEMFFVEDGHPNATGYAAISSCVATYLDLVPKP